MTQGKTMTCKARDLMASFERECSGVSAIESGIIADSLSIAIAVSEGGVGSAHNPHSRNIARLF